jgi:hypothetical protein
MPVTRTVCLLGLPTKDAAHIISRRTGALATEVPLEESGSLNRDVDEQCRSSPKGVVFPFNSFIGPVLSKRTANHRRGFVPQFMDFHEDVKLPAEAIQQITQETKDKKTDEFGVRQIELFHNPDGNVYCLLEAPDAEAVRSHHTALGLTCGEVHQVSRLL